MSTPSSRPKRLITHEDVDTWLHATSTKRLELHIQATAPVHSPERAAAFVQMSELVLDALEEVRINSASLREGSQKVRGESKDLRAHATQLRTRGTTLVEHMAQLAPRPVEGSDAERRLRNICNGDHRRE